MGVYSDRKRVDGKTREEEEARAGDGKVEKRNVWMYIRPPYVAPFKRKKKKKKCIERRMQIQAQSEVLT